MTADRFQQVLRVITDFEMEGLAYRRGTCLSCLKRVVSAENIDGDVQVVCPECPPDQFKAAIRKALESLNGAGPHLNGAGPVTNGKAAKGDEWEEPLPLYAISLPEFPIDALPSWVRRQVEATAEATQTPPDMAGMLALAVLATAAQKRAEALVRKGWREPLSLWTVTALPPGNRKSPAYAPMVAPVVDYERTLIDRMTEEIAVARSEFEVMEGTLKRLKDQAIKAKSEFERGELTRQLGEVAKTLANTKVPASPRMIVDDATPERLGMLLADQGGRMAVLSPEGDVFDMMAGKYSSSGANIGLYLRGHSGDDVIVDRVNRPTIIVRRAAITFGLTVQPEVLVGLTTNATFRGRGLLGRFLFVMPPSTLGSREVRPDAIPDVVAEEYHAKMTLCLAMPADQDEEGRPVPHLIAFDPEADDAVAEFETWIEPQLRPGGNLGYLADWAGKLAGQMVRIATGLHLAELAGTPEQWRFAVDGPTVAAARRIAEYLIPHARAAFQAMGTNPSVNGARVILEWVKDQGQPEFSKRDAYQHLRTRFDRPDDMDQSLVVLMENGYLRQIEPEKKEGPGRKPSPRFRCHPSLVVR